MAVRHGLGNYAGLEVDYLMGDTVFPVCSPALLESGPPLRRAEDLRHHTLLHDIDNTLDLVLTWEGWLKAAGITGVDPHRGPGFTHSNLLLQAAMDGQGVAMGRSALAGLDLDAGRLVRPFGPDIPSKLNYYVVTPEGRGEHPKIRAFRDWLLEEVARRTAGRASGNRTRFAPRLLGRDHLHPDCHNAAITPRRSRDSRPQASAAVQHPSSGRRFYRPSLGIA